MQVELLQGPPLSLDCVCIDGQESKVQSWAEDVRLVECEGLITGFCREIDSDGVFIVHWHTL